MSAIRLFLEQHGTDPAHDRGVIREDTDEIGAPFFLLVQASDRISAA